MTGRQLFLIASSSAVILLGAWGFADEGNGGQPDDQQLPLVYSEGFEGGLSGWYMTDPDAWELLEDSGSTRVLRR